MMPFHRPALVAALVAQPLVALEHLTVRHHMKMQHGQAPVPDLPKSSAKAPVSDLAKSSAKAHPEGVPLLKGMEELKALGKDVCLSVNEGYQFGALPETMGIINSVMKYTLQHEDVVTFAMPEIRPAARKGMDDYRWMFGEPEVTDTRWSTVYIAVCPWSVDTDDALTECSLDETVVYQNTVYLIPRVGPSCHAYVMVNSRINADYDYSLTGPLLSEMYWRRQAELGKDKSPQLQFPIATALHLQGDAGGAGSAEGVSADELEHIIEALTSMIDPKCLQVELHTNSTSGHAAVQAVTSSWKTNGVDEIQILDSRAEETEVFDRMASATILVGGASGFARLAAVLGKASVNIFINDAVNSHPIENLKGTATFNANEFDKTAVETSLARIPNMNQVIAECRAWLGK